MVTNASVDYEQRSDGQTNPAFCPSRKRVPYCGSLDTVEMIFELEEQFSITIPDSPEIKNRLSSFGTVGEVIKIVERDPCRDFFEQIDVRPLAGRRDGRGGARPRAVN